MSETATVPAPRRADRAEPDGGDGHVIVCGGGPLAHRLAVQLSVLNGRRVVVLVPSLTDDHGPRIVDLSRERPGSVEVREADRLDVAVLEPAGVSGAVALALTQPQLGLPGGAVLRVGDEGRQVIGALAVGREALLIAAVEVARSPRLRGVTVAEAHRPGLWRVLAVDLALPELRSPDLSQPDGGGPQLLWSPAADRVLVEGDRVVVAAAARGLGLLGSLGT